MPSRCKYLHKITDDTGLCIGYVSARGEFAPKFLHYIVLRAEKAMLACLPSGWAGGSVAVWAGEAVIACSILLMAARFTVVPKS